MLDERTLMFADKNAVYDPMRDTVVFRGKDGDKVITCIISREAIDDHYDGDNKDKLKAFNANRENIEHEARRKYLAGSVEADGSVLVRTGDL